jgi:NADPH:quinone reductase-like Zn-dependent oxidoreductase
MKAIVYHGYGSPDVLKCEDIEKPIPKDNEILIKVRAASLNPLDWHFMRGTPYVFRVIIGLRRPKFIGLGGDVAARLKQPART